MAFLNISAAARAAGKDRGTIQRAIKDGRLSASRDTLGRPQVDTAELMRVFGELKTDGSSTSAAGEQQKTADNSATQQVALEALQEQLKAALVREDWLKRQLEEEKERSRELERRMLPPAGFYELHAESKPQKKGFWARFFED